MNPLRTIGALYDPHGWAKLLTLSLVTEVTVLNPLAVLFNLIDPDETVNFYFPQTLQGCKKLVALCKEDRQSNVRLESELQRVEISIRRYVGSWNGSERTLMLVPKC